MAGYTRQSSFADGDTITAALFNNEYNQLVNAFHNSTGHTHDGTAASGPVIGLIGDAGETSPNNKVLIDTTNNHIEFYVEVSSSSVQQAYLADGVLAPVTDSDVDLGTSSLYFKNAYIDAITTTGNVAVGGNLTVTGTTTFNGGTITMGDAATDNVVFGADVDSNIIPDDDNTYDLGSSSQEWKDLYIDGIAYLDAINFNGTAITATAAELNILDGVTSTAAELNILDGVTATTAELNIMDGVTATTAELNIMDGVTSTATELNLLDGVTATTAELNILDGVTSTTAELNILDGVTSTAAELNILDGVTASATDINLIDGITNGTVIASKAIITDANKDITGGRNITISGELDAATLDISGDADIDGTLEADAITIGGVTLAETISDTVGAMVTSNTETGVTVTYDDSDNTLDFVIGTLNQNTTGTAATVTTAAQPNITSLGTLTTLTVDNVIVNGTTIGHTDDTDLMTVADGVLTVAGEVSMTTLDIGGTNVTSTAAELNILDGVTSTAAELNILDGVTSTAAELNILDGVTSTTAELNILDGVTSTAAELNILDGVTSTAAELNLLDGVTSTTAELNILDGVTSTATELNLLDGSTANTVVNSKAVIYGSSGELAGTLSTAAQTNITSLGTLTALTGGTGDFNWDSNTLVVDSSANRVGIGNASPDVSLDIGSFTDAIHVPVGTTAQRPGSPAAGYFRYNSTTGGFEGYTDEWGAIAGGGGGTAPVINTMTGDGSDTTLSLSAAPTNENATFVTLDGVLQHKDTYSISGSTLTFSTAPPSGVKVECITLSTTSINTATIMQDGDGDTKVQVEESSDEDIIRFDIAGTEQITLADGVLKPTTDNDVDLGTSSLKYKNFYAGLVDGENFKINGGQGSDGQVLTSTGSGVAWEDASSFNPDGAVVINESSADVDFRVESDGNANMLYVDGGKNSVGIGTTPEAHYTGYVGLDIGVAASLFSNASGTNITTLTNNGFLNSDASNWVYKVTDEASMYSQVHGDHRFSTAASGSADAAITWSEKIRFQAAGGISFNGDTAAANALDDYEEGTFTPGLGGATLTTATGKYTKIGNQVTVYYHVVTTGGLPTSSAQVQISSLPFTIDSNGAGSIYARYYTPNDSTLTTILVDGDTVVRLININEDNFDYTVYGELEASSNNSIDIRGTATYIAE